MGGRPTASTSLGYGPETVLSLLIHSLASHVFINSGHDVDVGRVVVT